MLPKLTGLEKVRERGQLGGGAEVALLTQISLEHVTQQLEELLETPFDRATVEDTYFFDLGGYKPHLPNILELTLSHGFVFEDPAAIPDPIVTEVRIAGTVNDLDTASLLDTTSFMTDLEKGHVIVTNTADTSAYNTFSPLIVGRGWVRVSYTAGFETQNTLNEPHGDYYTNVPAWLQDIAASLAFNRYGEMNAEAQLPTIGPEYLRATLERHFRKRGTALSPLRSLVA